MAGWWNFHGTALFFFFSTSVNISGLSPMPPQEGGGGGEERKERGEEKKIPCTSSQFWVHFPVETGREEEAHTVAVVLFSHPKRKGILPAGTVKREDIVWKAPGGQGRLGGSPNLRGGGSLLPGRVCVTCLACHTWWRTWHACVSRQ